MIMIGIISLDSCNKDLKPVKLVGEAQGTYYAITYYDNQERNFQTELDSLFRAFDMSASVYQKESIISRFNNNDTTVIADSVFTAVFKKAMEVSEKSGGAFDITVMPLVNAWGFGFTERTKLDSAKVDSLLPLVGYKKIKLVNGKLIKENPAMMIDYNAIAQGYTCDIIGDFLHKRGIDNYLVDVGGEVLAKGGKPDGSPWIVGVEKPAATAESAREVQIEVPLKNKALATSGNYRKFFIDGGHKYSHTIDPSTGFPVEHSLLSASVIAKDCMTADAYATVFMVFGLDKTKEFLSKNSELEAYLIYDDHGTLNSWKTKGFKIRE
ncbi:MAG TPA: FAD:protein FMN transferase [Lentimicrobium sp.]|nr:FAD:protein FMN transferase [Lentimicrobium sp.]